MSCEHIVILFIVVSAFPRVVWCCMYPGFDHIISLLLVCIVKWWKGKLVTVASGEMSDFGIADSLDAEQSRSDSVISAGDAALDEKPSSFEEDSNQGQKRRSSFNRTDRPIIKRKRKTSSCDSCRKLKTRCDYEPNDDKCHRCKVLKIECSLMTQKRDQISNESADDVKTGRDVCLRAPSTDEVESVGESHRMEMMERKLSLIMDRLDSLVGSKELDDFDGNDHRDVNSDWRHLRKYGNVKSNYLDNSIKNSPGNVITSIDSRLFKRVKSYQIFERFCRDEFLMRFYKLNKDLVLKLGTDFLTTAHFWIIPGGISQIDNEYVEKHPFITAVFVLISMSFDENYEYVKEQEQLYWIVKTMLGMALITTPLTDHDVEAILYCCIYNIARKPLQPLVDTWSLSGDGIKALMTSVRLIDIKRRITKEQVFDDVDLYHLRIWILLSINHLGISIDCGRPHLIPSDYFKDDLADLVLDFPNRTLGDSINHAQLKLMKIAYRMFYSKVLFERVIKFNETKLVGENRPGVCFKFKELEDWKERYKQLIEMDTSGTLRFTYEFYHITLSKRFISFYKKADPIGTDPVIEKYLKVGYTTSVCRSIQTLNRVVELKSSLIRGSPISLWNQVVYCCLTLYELNDKLDTLVGNFSIDSVLNLISRIYWKLNKIGETKNDATDTVGKIIKSLVDVSNQNQSDHENSQQITNVAADDDEMQYFIPLHDEINHQFGNDLDFTDIASKFQTFEEFFNDINKAM